MVGSLPLSRNYLVVVCTSIWQWLKPDVAELHGVAMVLEEDWSWARVFCASVCNPRWGRNDSIVLHHDSVQYNGDPCILRLLARGIPPG